MGLLNLCTNRETKISHIACFVLFFLSIIQVLILDSRAYLTNYKTHIELKTLDLVLALDIHFVPNQS